MMHIIITMKYGSAANKTDSNAYSGISVACPFFTRNIEKKEYYEHCIEQRNLENICAWALDHFDNYLLVIGDSLLKHNFMAFYGMNEQDALQKGLLIGNYWYSSCNEQIQKYQPRVRIIKWSELEQDTEFSRFIEIGQEFSSRNAIYKGALRALTLTSVTSEFRECKKRFGKESLENILACASSYARDEISGLLYVHEVMKYRTCISKYEPLPPIKAIYGGHYPELCDRLGLTEFGHVQISEKGKKIHCDDEFSEVYAAAKLLEGIEKVMPHV